MVSRLTGPHVWLAVGLPALTVTFGVQMLRAFIPMTLFDAGRRLQGDPTLIGILVITILAAAIIFWALHRLRHTRYPLMVSAGGVALLRLAVQAWEGDLLVDWYLSLVGIVLLVAFLSAYMGFVPGKGPRASAHLGLAFLLGLYVDTIVTAAFGTWPLFWRESAVAMTVIAVLVAVQLAGLTVAVRSWSSGQAEPVSGRGSITMGHLLLLLAAGAFLFLQIQVFQNVARLSALTEWELPGTFAWIAFSNTMGLVAAVWLLAYPRRANWHVAALGIVLVSAMSFERQDPAVAAMTLLAGQVSGSALFMLVLKPLGVCNTATRAVNGNGSAQISIGLVLMTTVVFLFIYYLGFGIKVPYNKDILLPLAGAIMAIVAVGASLSSPTAKPALGLNWLPALLGFGLISVPLVMLFTWNSPGFAPVDSNMPRSIKVMTYNLHGGFSADGALDPEAIARVIEEQQPDVVGLQEVSRGWVVNGSMDVLGWLSHRLQMPYLYGPTAGHLWGNAILTRYPIIESQEVELPPRNLALKRGFIWARLDVGGGQELQVITTHYHSGPGGQEGSDTRVEHSRKILEFIADPSRAGSSRTVLMGDLNARPEELEIEILREAGLVDVLGEIDRPYTFPSHDPERQIDYILVMPGLTARNPTVPKSTASDHLPVVAVLGP